MIFFAKSCQSKNKIEYKINSKKKMSFSKKSKFKSKIIRTDKKKSKEIINHFSRLADHLLIHILIYLPRKDICSFSIICKRFKKSCHQSWKLRSKHIVDWGRLKNTKAFANSRWSNAGNFYNYYILYFFKK